jgi:hypothetical protein
MRKFALLLCGILAMTGVGVATFCFLALRYHDTGQTTQTLVLGIVIGLVVTVMCIFMAARLGQEPVNARHKPPRL